MINHSQIVAQVSKGRIFCFLLLYPFLSVCFGQHSSIIDSLKSTLINQAPDTTKVKALNDLGGYMLNTGDYKSALIYLSEGAQLSEDLSYDVGLGNALNDIGILYDYSNEPDRAVQFYLRALEIRKRIGDYRGIADIVINLGYVYSNKGEYSKALNCYFISLKISESINYQSGAGAALLSIANIYLFQKQINKALATYFKVIKIKEAKDDPYIMAAALGNIGLCYHYLHNNSEALKYYSAAVTLAEKSGDAQGLGVHLLNTGIAYGELGNLGLGLQFLERSLKICNEIDDKVGMCEAYGGLGEFYAELDKNEMALNYLLKQLMIATEIGSKMEAAKAALAISKQYEKMGNFQQALEYHVMYKSLDDELNRELSQKGIHELEIKYNAEKNEKEIEALKNEKIRKEIRLAKQQQIYLVVALTFIIIVLTLFFLYNRNRVRKKNTLERENLEIQLQSLSEQMNPHFIFNALNSIMEFIRISHKDAAIRYLTKFSRLIRLVLESTGKKTIPIHDEIDLLILYMDLENLRFGNTFIYDMQVDEKIAGSELEIPPLIIQPFIENAILHGIQNKLKDNPEKGYTGRINIILNLKGDFLSCTIRDNGIGREKALDIKNQKLFNQESLGMRITSNRLNLLTQNKCEIDFIDLKDGNNQSLGTEVKILVPLMDPY